MIKDGDIVVADEKGNVTLDMGDGGNKAYTVSIYKNTYLILTPKKEEKK